MGKIKKIPKHSEIKKQREEEQAEKEARAREQLIQFLQDKSLKMYFHFALGLESLEYLKITEEYKKDLKLHGNRFLKSLEKNILTKMDQLYPNNPEFTSNMERVLDETAGKWSQLLFADYICVNEMADVFLEDPENFRKNVRAKFIKLDTK
jgi:hypothetical protein